MFENIYFLDVEKADEPKIKKAFPQARIFNKKISPREIVKKCYDAEILCVFIHTQLNKYVIEKLPNLKLIVTRSVGYDHIDLVAAQKKGVKVCNVPDYGSHVIAEHVFALLLSGLRHIGEGDERVEEKGIFSFAGLRGVSLKGKTLGIVGVGKIGSNVARIASLGFLMNVLAYDPHPDRNLALENHFQYVRLKTLWKKSDIITLHCPLLPSTRHLVNQKTISLMKKGVVIVNTSRGKVIDTKSLIKGLKTKKISFAFLDVLEHEDNIKKHKKLISMPNVIVTPHIAFYADDSMQTMYSKALESIYEFLNGQPLKNQILGT